MTKSWKKMLGSEGTGEYVVVARNTRGDRIGVRPLGDGQCRIRVEPIDTDSAKKLQRSFTPEKGWKQTGEDGQFRFSLVATGDEGRAAVVAALDVVEDVTTDQLERNHDRQAWQWRSLFNATA